jgi:hypothetical protein
MISIVFISYIIVARNADAPQKAPKNTRNSAKNTPESGEKRRYCGVKRAVRAVPPVNLAFSGPISPNLR